MRIKHIPVMLIAICAPAFVSAQVNSTSQDIEGLSWKKGLTAQGGGVSFENTFYKGNDSIVNRDPYAFYLTGHLNLNACGVEIPLSFAYSNTSKTYLQSFNRFQIAPKYKWAQLYIGSNSMMFSKYTLAGHQFTGVGAVLTPRNWEISAMYGELNKAVEYDSRKENLNSAAYRRMGYGMKVGYAKNGDEVSAIFFHAKDDKNSLDNPVPDSANLHPQENTAIQIGGKKTLFKNFYVQAEYAISIYNSELRDSLMGNELHGTFIDKVLGRKGNDQHTDAINASTGYQNKRWGVALRYERVSPNYQTLGGYYFTNDVETYTIAPNVNFFKGKLRLTGNLGFEFNNLDNTKANDTRRVVGSANISYATANGFNAVLSYSNFSTYTKYKPESYPFYTDKLDTLNFYQINQTLTANTCWSFGNKTGLMNSVALCGSYQYGSEDCGDTTSLSDFVNGTLNFGEQYMPVKMSWSLFVSGNYCTASGIEQTYWGPGISLGKSLLKDKLSLNISASYNQSKAEGETAYSVLNSNFSAKYNLPFNKKFGAHSLSLNSSLTNNYGGTTDGEYEFLTTLKYDISF